MTYIPRNFCPKYGSKIPYLPTMRTYVRKFLFFYRSPKLEDLFVFPKSQEEEQIENLDGRRPSIDEDL